MEDEDPEDEDMFEDNCKTYDCIGSSGAAIVQKY